MARKGYKPTDDVLGRRYINQYGERYTWMYEAWHSYERGVWKADDVNPLISMWELLIEHKDKGIKPSADKVTSILKYGQLYLRPGDDEIDSARYINLRNGVYNLETQQLEAHQRELYMTSQLSFDYAPKADCPTWESFLDSVLVMDDGRPDFALQNVVQQAFGYSLTANTDHRVSFWLVGPSGTGKSTLLNVLIELAGDSHASIDLEFLTKNEYQFAHLPGKRLVTFTEPSSGTKLEDGAYKRLVSQDMLTGRHPHGRPFEFVGEFKVWGAMNELPRVTDRSDAVYNRVIIIPMNHIVPPAQRDPKLIDKLRNEKAGIFNWALEGLRNLTRTRSFDYSVASDEARQEWRIENDTEAAFVEDICELKLDAEVPARSLYRAYKEWCRQNGYYSKSERTVARDWVRLGATKTRKASGMVYQGIAVKQSEINLICRPF